MATTSSHSTRVDRRDTARRLLQRELEQLTPEERVVVERFISRGRVSRDVRRELHASRTLGERVADRVAAIGGSWAFIVCFGVVLVAWMVANSFLLAKAFDPYPYILLNLVLSCLAAVQAPIIMMSQNRQAAVDRKHAENDYQVNVKSELEVLQIHEKLDLLRSHEWALLVEQQNRQIEMLQRLLECATAAPGDGRQKQP
ncbi:MAG TPA: cyclic nucleotide-binding protein [Stenotrophomonas sp.]|nr:cyclic nucleotide-binding protein [Stenotrophomonas sp.]